MYNTVEEHFSISIALVRSRGGSLVIHNRQFYSSQLHLRYTRDESPNLHYISPRNLIETSTVDYCIGHVNPECV
jgi:hypothetical protein